MAAKGLHETEDAEALPKHNASDNGNSNPEFRAGMPGSQLRKT